MHPIDSQFHPELIHESVFVAANATLLGNVRLAVEASVWFGAVVRGDTEVVEVGERSNVQDLCVLHADPGFPCQIGKDVTIGHGAVVHGATIEDGAMVGIRAVVLNGAKIGAGSIVAAGAVVTEGKVIPPNSLVMGVPAKVVRELSQQQKERSLHAAAHYVHAAKSYRAQSASAKHNDA